MPLQSVVEIMQFRRRRRQAREVDGEGLRIDVIVQPHVETVDRKIARLAAIPFVADVQFLGAPRLKLGIAAARRPWVDRNARPARLQRRLAFWQTPPLKEGPNWRACHPCADEP